MIGEDVTCTNRLTCPFHIFVPQAKSRGWFEDDESFEERVNSLKGVAASRPKKGAAKKQQTSTPAWVAAPSSKKTKPKSKAVGSKKSSGAGGVFAAMMMDSDSD